VVWLIKCSDSRCAQQTRANNIVDLIRHHLDAKGRFVCLCGKWGYVKKRFKTQEGNYDWEPILRGIIPLAKKEDTYQPFVFLVSYETGGEIREIKDVWFSYYKDLRKSGGRLKLGYGPGGPPVLSKAYFLTLLSRLVQTRYLTPEEVTAAIGK